VARFFLAILFGKNYFNLFCKGIFNTAYSRIKSTNVNIKISSMLSPLIVYALDAFKFTKYFCFLNIYLSGDGMLIYDYYEIKKAIKKFNNKIWVVLKSDAYFFGIDKIFDICISANVYNYVVVDIYEAVHLRKKNDNINILLLGRVYKDKNILKKYNIISSLCSMADYQFLVDNNLKYYAKINTTMNRFGIDIKDLIINNNLLGIYTHIASMNDDFINIDKTLKKIANEYKLDYHIGGGRLNSYLSSPIRVGMELYKRVRRFYGYVIYIRNVKKGEHLGYDNGYISDSDIVVGILNVGYSNGIKRGFRGYVSNGKNRYQVIGNVCMNHTFIKIDSSISNNDRLEFFGDYISIEEFLTYNDMTYYESFFQIK